MPNWVINKINLSGPLYEIEKFETEVLDLSEKAGEDGKVFSFEKIVPMPEQIRNTTSPNPQPEIKTIKDSEGNEVQVKSYSMYLNEFQVNRAIERGETPPDLIPCNNATPEQQDELLVKYGRTNWYDWSLHNWGTKWDARESRYDEDMKVLTFQTAWDCPKALLEAMIRKYPEITFAGGFADEDIGHNSGYIEDGEVSWFVNGDFEAIQNAKELWGFED